MGNVHVTLEGKLAEKLMYRCNFAGGRPQPACGRSASIPAMAL